MFIMQTVNELNDHYITFHNVDQNNCFFKKFFNESKNKILCQKCFNPLMPVAKLAQSYESQ